MRECKKTISIWNGFEFGVSIFSGVESFFLHDFLYGFNYRPMIDVVGKKSDWNQNIEKKKFAQKLMLVHMFVLEWFLHIQMCTKYDNECFECESNINFFPYFFLCHQLHYAFLSNKNRLFSPSLMLIWMLLLFLNHIDMEFQAMIHLLSHKNEKEENRAQAHRMTAK